MLVAVDACAMSVFECFHADKPTLSRLARVALSALFKVTHNLREARERRRLLADGIASVMRTNLSDLGRMHTVRQHRALVLGLTAVFLATAAGSQGADTASRC
jgi:hypothetical protein